MSRGTGPRIAIVSDALVQRGGAERTVEVMAQTFPDAPIFALLYSPRSGPAALASRIVPSALNRIPGATRRHRLLLPLYPAAIESFDLRGYDVILSSHHTAAKGVLRTSGQVHVSYCHTPMRALWERGFEELRTLPAPARPFAAAMFRRLREWDVATTSRVDRFIANSRTTQRRIAKHYRRTSDLLHPPIDVRAFQPHPGIPVGDYYLFASRLVPYKRVDLAIAATAAIGRRLVVVGGGPGEGSVRGIPHVDYRGHVSDRELLHLMCGARALVFPAFEDFGMAPVEMMACGRPAIAYGAGGALDTVIDGETGILADAQDVEAFVTAIRRCEATAFDPRRLREHAESFSSERFALALREIVLEAYADEIAARPRNKARDTELALG